MNGQILIVEDNKEISTLISNFLTKNGYEVKAVYEGNAASETVPWSSEESIYQGKSLRISME